MRCAFADWPIWPVRGGCYVLSGGVAGAELVLPLVVGRQKLASSARSGEDAFFAHI